MAGFFESTGAILAVLTPLVAIPLTVITFYLRSLREHQITWHGEWVRRMEACESRHHDLHRKVSEMERDYTTKEEWLRECIHFRGRLEHLAESTTRLETLLQSDPGDRLGGDHDHTKPPMLRIGHPVRDDSPQV